LRFRWGGARGRRQREGVPGGVEPEARFAASTVLFPGIVELCGRRRAARDEHVPAYREQSQLWAARAYRSEMVGAECGGWYRQLGAHRQRRGPTGLPKAAVRRQYRRELWRLAGLGNVLQRRKDPHREGARASCGPVQCERHSRGLRIPGQHGWPDRVRAVRSNDAALKSGDNLRDQLAVDVGETHVAAVEEIGQLRVIDAEQVQHRGVQVMDGDGLLLGFIPELVAGSDDLTAFDAGAGHPYGHGAGVVVAADALLRDRHAAEFAVPDDERVVEEAAGLEIR